MPADGDPAKPITLPVAMSGRLGDRGDQDGYRFPARKGSTYAFEVIASRAGSDCDPVLRLFDPKGAIVTESDDTRGLGKDLRLEWRAPAVHFKQSRNSNPAFDREESRLSWFACVAPC